MICEKQEQTYSLSQVLTESPGKLARWCMSTVQIVVAVVDSDDIAIVVAPAEVGKYGSSAAIDIVRRCDLIVSFAFDHLEDMESPFSVLGFCHPVVVVFSFCCYSSSGCYAGKGCSCLKLIYRKISSIAVM